MLSMQNMNNYYDFSGQKFGYPLSLSINSFDRQVFSRQSSLELSYVLKGEYEAITEKFTTPVKEHELMIIAPNDIHMIRHKGQEENIILTIHIDFTRFAVPMVGNVEQAFESMLCTDQHNPILLSKLKLKIGELVHMLLHDDSNIFHMNAIMMELIYIASNHNDYPIEHLPLQSEHHENYMKAIQYIDQHYVQELQLKDVADTLSFSISYTSKLFKKYTGIPFVKYLAYVRIRASLELLLEGKETIEQLAGTCGMPNSKAYTAAFKELYGVTPSTYRKKFIRNLKINEEKKEQIMHIDEKQKALLSHLIEETKDVLYQNAGIQITNKNHAFHCRITVDETTSSVITQNQGELTITIKNNA